jgi:predicted HTH transcriptional regulator
MIYKRLDSIKISDLQSLIDNEVGENKTIEYKSELKLDSGDERKEFLADITSFANADGGDIIYGIKENPSTNLPSEINGIEIESNDELIRKIESILRDAVSPRIPDVDFKIIECTVNCYVLIMRVGASLLSPHRVTYKGYDKFFSRNAKGKYPMDVNELRTAFTMSHSLTQEIEDYKKELITSIETMQKSDEFREYRQRLWKENEPLREQIKSSGYYDKFVNNLKIISRDYDKYQKVLHKLNSDLGLEYDEKGNIIIIKHENE